MSTINRGGKLTKAEAQEWAMKVLTCKTDPVPMPNQTARIMLRDTGHGIDVYLKISPEQTENSTYTTLAAALGILGILGKPKP